MRISVLINTYNYERFLGDAIDSALRQSHPAHEIVIVDDGSTDATNTTLRAKYEALTQVTWIRQENQGQLAAFQTAIAQSTGDLVFFLDADDTFESDYIAHMVEYYQNHPTADFVYSEPQRFEGEGVNSTQVKQPISYDYGISIIRELVTKQFIGRSTSALSAKRSVLNKLFPFPPNILKEWKICADECLVHGAGLCGANKHYYGIKRVNWRVHGNNSYTAKAKSNSEKYLKKTQVYRFINYLASRYHLNDELLGLAMDEYKTIPKPSTKDTTLYNNIYRNYRYSHKRDRNTTFARLKKRFLRKKPSG